jgi:Ca2+/Na+ antiporter
MNRTQKAALYGLYLVAFMLLIPLVDLVDTKINPILLRVIGYPLVILLVLPIWFLTKKKKTEVDMDERDKAIIRKACIIAVGIVMGGLLTVYTLFIFMSSSDNKITTSTLQGVVFFAFTVFLLVFSSAILIQYGWRDKDGAK